MSKYFDHDFFKFLTGFIAILAISFVLLYASQRWGSSINGVDTSYVEADASGE